jgi:hypothetical protein
MSTSARRLTGTVGRWSAGHPWTVIAVYADASRRIRVADPDGREMMISCGAAVFTLRVALRYLGWLPRTRPSAGS